MKNQPVKIIVAILIVLLAISSVLYGYLGIKYQDNITQAIRSVFISEKTEPDSNGFYYSKPAPATFVSLAGSAATPITTPTGSPSISPSITLSPSSTPSNTPTMTVSPTVTLPITTIPITSTPLPTITATPRVTITPTTTPTPTATPTPTPTPSPKYHVQYYGYYFTNDYASQQSSANTGFVNMDCSAFPDVSRTAQLHISKVNTLQSFKLKAIIDLFPILFDCTKPTLTLMPDWQARWNSYLSIMKPYQSKILAFYPIDEPDIHASNSDFTKIADYMRSTMNNQGVNTPILAVFSFLAVPKIRDGQYTIPSSVNWVSFDEYNCWGTECANGLTIAQKMNILLQKVKPWGGKVFLIPDGVEFSTAVPSYSRQQQWVTRADLFYNLCRQTEDCIGLLPFVWDPPTYANMVGIKKMDLVKQKFDAIGTDVLINAR